MTADERTYWDAATYDRIAKPMRMWAQEVIDDLALKGDETVLDAGCGSGSVTFDLWEKLPRGKIIALDSSPQMVEQLSKSIAERGITNIVARQADLASFEVDQPVDVVFSNAVFHWISNDDGLFGSLARATKPGGRLRAQCGGQGNIAKLMDVAHEIEAREPYSKHLTPGETNRKFRSPEDVRVAMERNGWRNVRADMFESPQKFEDRDEAALYLRTIILQMQVAALPEELGEAFLQDVIAEVIARHGEPFAADYVRLNIWAERA